METKSIETIQMYNKVLDFCDEAGIELNKNQIKILSSLVKIPRNFRVEFIIKGGLLIVNAYLEPVEIKILRFTKEIENVQESKDPVS